MDRQSDRPKNESFQCPPQQTGFCHEFRHDTDGKNDEKQEDFIATRHENSIRAGENAICLENRIRHDAPLTADEKSKTSLFPTTDDRPSSTSPNASLKADLFVICYT